jgi:hypothetical protein
MSIKRLVQNILRFIFVSTPVWIWDTIILESMRQGWKGFERIIRKNARYILCITAFLLLLCFQQYEALHILLAITIFVISLRLIPKIFGKKKKNS